MTQAKIEGKFYPLQNKEWLTTAKKLNRSELLVLYHLRTLEPFGDKLIESSTKDVAKATGISQRSVQRALIKLEELELIDLQIQTFSFKLRSQHLTENDATLINDTDDASSPTLSHHRQPCRIIGNLVAMKDTNDASPAILSQSSPETFTEQEFQSSKTIQTIQTKKDFFQTLSESEEREKKEILISETSFSEEKSEKDKAKAENIAFFNSLNGVQKEAVIRAADKYFLPRLSQYPSLPLAWIKCHAIEIAHTDACNQEIDLIDAELASDSEAKYTLQDIQEMYPDCWKEMLPYFGALLAF
jgi:DNA-binding MarR family transcriptional regulator